MENKNLRSADILSSGIFILLGLGICINSFGMIRDNPDVQGRIYASAGLMPLVFGILLIVTSTVVLIHGIREGGDLKLFAPSSIWKGMKSNTGITILFIYSWLAVYVFILLKVLPYFISTLVFMVVFMFRFYSRRPAVVLIVSIIVSAAVTYVFGSVINIPLPGR